jgi:DNA-binding FadR family transcriptional regulator
LLKVQKISEIVAEDIRLRIAQGEIADGDLLAPEPDMIQQYWASRPTLREAIRILETEGLVTATRGGPKGARVHCPALPLCADR